MANDLLFGKDARKKIAEGIKILADAASNVKAKKRPRSIFLLEDICQSFSH